MLAHRIPYPPHTGDKVRAYHIARYLARRHEVTLAFLVDDPADLGGVQPLQEMVSHVEFARLWKPWSLCKGSANPLPCGTSALVHSTDDSGAAPAGRPTISFTRRRRRWRSMVRRLECRSSWIS
jgi:hypothetical protein